MPILNQLKQHYRAEIDGIRAIAVILILFYHAGFGWASGGYIGVDVFFVISGFLITGNIRREIKHGGFSFKQFYVRRIKRLFPALLASLLVTWFVALWLFSPADFQRLGTALQYAILSASNFFFWQESGYFNLDSGLKPLLHTWSLAVEEQFYLIWPALVVALSLWFQRSGFILFLLLAMALSLWLNSVYMESSPSAVFFHLPFRIFEFAIGAMCLFIPTPKHQPCKFLSPLAIGQTALSLIGMALILYATLVFDKDTVFPGFNALIPCLGTALLIISAQSSAARYLLSHKLMVGIGWISYSVYLIHWPLMVMFNYWKFTDSSNLEKLVLVAMSLFLGYLIWQFVEKPNRFKTQPQSLIKFYLKFTALLVSMVVLGYLTQYYQGWPNRYPHEYSISQQQIQDNRARYWQDFNQLIESQNSVESDKKVVVMGNSHAVDLIYAMHENKAQLHFTFFNSWFKCFNFGSAVNPQDKPTCDKKRNQHFKSPAWQQAQAIYLHDNWGALDLDDLNSRILQIRTLSQAPIYIFGPKMTYTKTIPAIVHAHMRMATINQYSQQFSEFDYLNRVNTAVKHWVENSTIANLNYIDVMSVQCGSDYRQCQIISAENQQFLYFDRDHFTLQGAKEFGQKLKLKHPDLFSW